MNSNLVAKIINSAVTGDKFVSRDTNEYIYASLSQPPIRIVDKCGSEDELDFMVECPNCGSCVNYGHDIFMISGRLYCNVGNCYNKLLDKNPYLKGKY